MVRGLEIFKTFFRDHSDKYILIGGAACDVLFSEAGLPLLDPETVFAQIKKTFDL
ncbi:hypothetical protein BMS3Abin05_00043 [bacterium BMS3Abin05]|nr:hypothetical protein BMS3Abin05_00043 [bacterium BMS3Abin05]